MHRLYVTCMEALYFGAHACIDGGSPTDSLDLASNTPRGSGRRSPTATARLYFRRVEASQNLFFPLSKVNDACKSGQKNGPMLLQG